ncbi:MAG: diguanylate cyclase [Anaerolineales bacterium]
MNSQLTHDIELYSLESFKTLLEHEVHRSHRYKSPLTLVHLAIETDPDQPDVLHSAELFTINVLDVQLRDTDIPCRKGNEFLVLMPATFEEGGCIACERLAKSFNEPHQTFDRVSFNMAVYVGMSSIPAGESLTSENLMQQASKAMQYARDNHMTTAVTYSEIV